MDVYAIVTEKIINLLEQGVVPWRRPWTAAGLPRNVVSKKPYRGINHFLLSASKYVSPFWLTMRQANELGGHVRKGEESTIVVFWKVDDAKQSTEDLDDEETDEKTRRRFVLRYYRVCNLEQCELPQAVLDKLPKIETHEHDPIEAAERIIAGMPNPPEIQHAGSKAFYSSDHRSHHYAAAQSVRSARRILRNASARDRSTAPVIRKRLAREGITEAAAVRFRRLLQRRIDRGNGSALIFAPKPESRTQSSRIRPHMWPAGSRSFATIANFSIHAAAQAQHAADFILSRPHPVA